MARIAVLEYEQTPASQPVHYISKSLAEKFRACRHRGSHAVIKVDDRTLWIRVKVSFRKLKEWLKEREDRALNRYVPEYLPPIELPGIWFDGPRQAVRGHELDPLFSATADIPC